MKVLINRAPKRDQCWGGGNLFVTAFCDLLAEAGHEAVHQIEPGIRAILLMDPRYDELGVSIREIASFKELRPETLVVHRVNECDARKDTTDMDDLLRSCSTISDKTVFVSEWMHHYHQERGWQCEDTYVVYNGVNQEHFFEVEV